MRSEETVLSYVGYESMRNAGFDIVRNNELKKEIIQLFELTYDRSQDRNNRVGQVFVEVQKIKHARFMRKSGFRFAPFDYDSLIEDKEYLSWLHSIKNNREWVNSTFKESLEETLRVTQLIKDELNESQ